MTYKLTSFALMEDVMNADYSKQALLNFIQYASEKGLVNASSAKTWRVSVNKLLVDLSPSEESDVRTIDADIVARKFANRHPSALTPESLYTYRYRLSTAVQEFVAWTNDPVGYKPKGMSSKPSSNESKSRPMKSKNDKKPSGNDIFVATGHSEEHSLGSDGLPLPFPIRPNFLAQVIIPRDLTMDEARRLYAFLQTLTVDFQPSERAVI